MNAFRGTRPAGAPVVIAHRGDSSHAPENTIEAAALGFAAGAFAWELDVHLSRDGVAVVHHDETLVRTTDAPRRFARDPRAADGFRLSDFDWDEIRLLDAGSWFVNPAGGARSAVAFGTYDALDESDRLHFASGAVRVPSLVESLEWTRGRDWLVNVELKSFPESDPSLLDAVLAAIDRTGTADRVLVSSFDHRDMARLARWRPDIAAGVLCETPLHRPAEYVRRIVGADFYHPSFRAVAGVSRRDQAAASHHPRPDSEQEEEPVPCFVYTVNDSRPGGLAERLASIGVAGVFTDDPSGLGRLWGGGPSPRRGSFRTGLAGGSIRPSHDAGSSLKAHQTPQG